MNHKMYPLAYKLSPKQTCTLYYLGFPTSWKAALLNIARKTNPKFKNEYGLPTNALKKLVDSWMEGIIALAPLKKDSHDERWLTSCYEYSEENLRALCGIIMTWVKATYVTSSRVNPIAKKLAKEFCDTMNLRRFAPRTKSVLRLRTERFAKPLIRRFRFWRSTVCWEKRLP